MRLILILTSVLVIASCGKSDPYQGKPVEKLGTPPVKVDTPKLPEPEPEPEPIPVEAYSLDVQDVVYFKEGFESVFPIAGEVPPPGKPKFRFSNLPSGAVFDEQTLTISWMPGLDVVKQEDGYLIIAVDVYLMSSESQIIALQKKIVFVIKNINDVDDVPEQELLVEGEIR